MSRFPPEAFAVADFPAREPDRHPDTLAWIARIEAIRTVEPDPSCPDCRAAQAHLRRCSRCRVPKPLAEAFARDRNKPLGRRYVCRDCKQSENERSNAERKRRQFRAVLGRTA